MQPVFDEIINSNQSDLDSYVCVTCGLRHSFNEINPHNYQNNKKRQREDQDLPIKKYKKKQVD